MSMQYIQPEIWAARMIALLQKVLPAMTVCNTGIAQPITKKGDKLHIITGGEVNDADYPASADITYGDPSDTDSELDIDIDRYFAIKIEDKEKLQASVPWSQLYTQRGVYSLKDYMDTQLLAEYANAGLDSYETGSTAWQLGTDAADVPKFLDSIMKQLDDADALQQPGVPYIIGPTILKQAITRYVTTRATNLGDQVLTSGMGAPNGYYGHLGGFNLYVSRNCATVSTTVHALAGIEGDGIACAQQIMPGSIEALRLHGRFATGVRGRMLGGIKTYRSGTVIDVNLNTSLLA